MQGKDNTEDATKGNRPRITAQESFLREQGIYEEVTVAAIKRILARHDPDNDLVTLATLRKAATVVGREIRLELV
ncbi:MAG: hypothetical protein ACKV2U_19660 [Bryobacteraceae bacterium]